MGRIKAVRKARGLSLAQVAKLAGLHSQAIARAERKGQDPRASTVLAIAKALNVPVCKLFEESGHGRQRKERTQKS